MSDSRKRKQTVVSGTYDTLVGESSSKYKKKSTHIDSNTIPNEGQLATSTSPEQSRPKVSPSTKSAQGQSTLKNYFKAVSAPVVLEKTSAEKSNKNTDNEAPIFNNEVSILGPGQRSSTYIINETQDLNANSSGDEDCSVSELSLKKIFKRPNFEIPKWLQKYFIYIGHFENSINKRSPIKLSCRLCGPSSKATKGIVGAPYSNFHRHLKEKHSKDYEIEEKRGNIGFEIADRAAAKEASNPEITSFTSSTWKKPNNDDAYSMSHAKQKQFITDLMDCNAIDQLPLDMIGRPCFIKMVRNLDSHVRIFTRQTLNRKFKQFYEHEFKSRMSKVVEGLNDETCHVVLDMWSDRKKSSMNGFKTQFIDSNWELKNMALAFRHFPDRHTGGSIRKCFQEVFKDTFGISPEKVGFVSGDNAANVKAAFKKNYDYLDEQNEDLNYDEISTVDENDEIDFIDFDDLMADSDDDVDELEQSDLESVFEELNNWGEREFTKLECNSHIVQLLIKDAMNKVPAVKSLVKDANTVKTFFRSSPFWYDKFKKQAGMGLTEQAKTRWNTIFYVFERLIKPEVQIALNDILAETRKTKTPCKVLFSTGDYITMKAIVSLLQPLQELTDTLQADSVTSSLILPSICHCYKEIQKLDTEDIEAATNLQTELLHRMEERFGPRPPHQTKAEETRFKRISRNQVFTNENLIVASLLDPRVKMAPFKLKFLEHDGLNNGACSPEKAEEVLRKYYDIEKLKVPRNSEPPPEIPKKPSESKSLFSTLDEVDSSASPSCSAIVDEVTNYLQIPRDNQVNALRFWKENERSNKFPVLTRLAKKFLGFPASSGSVERLFSIAGALQRSRRASLSWKTLEMLLCYRDLRIANFFNGMLI